MAPPRPVPEPTLEQAFAMLQQLAASSDGARRAAGARAADGRPGDDADRGIAALPEAPSGTLLVDRDRRILHLDSGAEHVFRCKAAEMVGTRVGILVVGNLPDQQAGPVDAVCRRRDGSTFPAEIALSQFEIEGHPVCVLVVRDKETFIRIAAEHREAELRFRHLVEQIPAVTFTGALQGGGLGEIYVSPQIETLLGYSQDEWISNPVLWYERLHPDDRVKLDGEFARGCMSGGPFRAECRFIARDGAVVWVHGEARIIRDAGGRPLFLQGVAFNVTDIRRLHEEQAARAAAEREHHKEKLLSDVSAVLAQEFGDDVPFQAIAELVAPAYCDWCIIDVVDDSGVWRCVAVAHGERADRGTADEMRRRDPAWKVGSPPPRRRARSDHGPAGGPSAGADDPERARILGAVGARSIAVFPLRTRGRVLGVLSLVSARGSRPPGGEDGGFGAQLAEGIATQLDNARLYRDAQDAVEARDRLVLELERAVHFSEMFVGILGHDLRNPLGSIVTAASLLERRAVGEGLTRPVGRIFKSAERMRRMIDQILDFTSIRLGRGLPLRRSDLDLGELCRAVLDELSDERRPAATRLTVRGQADGRWDGDRLSQLVSNLVGNALQHRVGQLPIDIRVDGTDGADVVVEVWNEGVVPEDLIPVLFEPLRTAGSKQNGSSGLGLGLFISREIARAHDGEIEVLSSLETGTRFHVRLPRRRAPRRTAPTSRRSAEK